MTVDGDIQVCLCRDDQVIRRILANDYYDSPICYFNDRLVNAAAKWISRSPDTAFVVAASGEEIAGFAFAECLGTHLWYTFCKSHLHLLPDIAWALAKKRGIATRRLSTLRGRHAAPTSSPNKVDQLGLKSLDSAFQWTPPGCGTGYVNMVYVAHGYRGRGLATRLICRVADEMCGVGVQRLEAHIDAGNYASLRSFVAAGWEVARAKSAGFKAVRDGSEKA